MRLLLFLLYVLILTEGLTQLLGFKPDASIVTAEAVNLGEALFHLVALGDCLHTGLKAHKKHRTSSEPVAFMRRNVWVHSCGQQKRTELGKLKHRNIEPARDVMPR